MKQSILVIEDDASLVEVISYNLRDAGYSVTTAASGDDGLRLAKAVTPSLVVLDIMLPGLSGIEVCQRIRTDAAIQHIPVIILTAKSDEADQLIGFAVGADDYVTKPFSVRVLLERVKSLLRRRTAMAESQIFESQGVRVDAVQHRVTVDAKELELTPSEFGLLETMLKHPGRAFSRSQLIDQGLGGDTLVLERTIDVHIRSLRIKLGARANLIETVRGVGYRFRRAGDA